ncbi:MAG: site-2 protease family protein [Myxococcota bacterium]
MNDLFDPKFIAMLPIWWVAFLFSLTCHEAAHALVAKWGGDRTAHEAGQVSLSPIPHIRREPFGTVIVPLVSYFLNQGGWMLGWASAPFNPIWAHRHPRRAAWMAAAGPAANFCIAFIVGVILSVGVLSGTFEAPSSVSFTRLAIGPDGAPTAATTLLSILFTLNLLLGTFNLLPVPPLDGHAVVGLVLSDDNARRWSEFARDPTFSILGLVLAWYGFGYIWNPVFSLALGLLYPWLSYG